MKIKILNLSSMEEAIASLDNILYPSWLDENSVDYNETNNTFSFVVGRPYFEEPVDGMSVKRCLFFKSFKTRCILSKFEWTPIFSLNKKMDRFEYESFGLKLDAKRNRLLLGDSCATYSFNFTNQTVLKVMDTNKFNDNFNWWSQKNIIKSKLNVIDQLQSQFG